MGVNIFENLMYNDHEKKINCVRLLLFSVSSIYFICLPANWNM